MFCHSFLASLGRTMVSKQSSPSNCDLCLLAQLSDKGNKRNLQIAGNACFERCYATGRRAVLHRLHTFDLRATRLFTHSPLQKLNEMVIKAPRLFNFHLCSSTFTRQKQLRKYSFFQEPSNSLKYFINVKIEVTINIW